MNILITGGTGFIGSALISALTTQGHTVFAVTRQTKPNRPGVIHIAAPGADELFSPAIIAKTDAIINLAGQNIGDRRWTSAVKQGILESRLTMTRQLTSSIDRNAGLGMPYPRVLVNASAVGYYGVSDNESFTEDSPPGAGFLASVCQQWERQAQAVQADDVRVAIMRFGIVLGPGGALKRMALPFAFGMGGIVGSGRQWMSWVHRDDVVSGILYALSQPLQGPYNLTSPQPIQMEGFMKSLAVAVGGACWTRMPSWAARLIFGEMADEMLLHGQRALPQRLQSAGFTFSYENLEAALTRIMANKSK